MYLIIIRFDIEVCRSQSNSIKINVILQIAFCCVVIFIEFCIIMKLLDKGLGATYS